MLHKLSVIIGKTILRCDLLSKIRLYKDSSVKKYCNDIPKYSMHRDYNETFENITVKGSKNSPTSI